MHLALPLFGSVWFPVMTSPATIALARRVRCEIARQCVDWADVAHLANMSERQLRRRLHSEVDFTVPELMAVAAALGQPGCFFLAEPDDLVVPLAS